MSILKIMMNDIQNSAHTVGSKVLMGVSAPNIMYQLNELLPDFIAEPVVWVLGRFYDIEWVEGLSTIAIFMLIVERYYAAKLSIAKRKEIEGGSK